MGFSEGYLPQTVAGGLAENMFVKFSDEIMVQRVWHKAGAQ